MCVVVICRAAFTSTTDEVSTTAGKSPTDEMAVTDETAVTDEMAVTADVLPADNPSSDVTMSPSDELSPSPPADDESPPADDASPPADASPPTEMPPIARVVDAVMSECRRQDVAYRRHAIRCLSEILAVHDVDRFPDVFKLLQPLLSEVRALPARSPSKSTPVRTPENLARPDRPKTYPGPIDRKRTRARSLENLPG